MNANWQEFSDADDLRDRFASAEMLVVFKHSTRCSISQMALRRFEAEWSGNLPIYMIRVIEERPLSNLLAELSGVRHESPQLLVIRSGRVVHQASHAAIFAEDVINAAA